MAFDSTFVLTGRQLRTVWSAETEELSRESAHYAKKRLTLLDYLSNVSQSGHNIRIRTDNFNVHGTLVHLGADFFSVASSDEDRTVHSFRLNPDGSKLHSSIEIDIAEQSERAFSTQLLRHDKSFRSLLEDVFTTPEYCEIETTQGNVYSGPFDMLQDCIAVHEKNAPQLSMTLITQDTTIVPIDGVVSVLYTI